MIGPAGDRMQEVNLQIIARAVPAQDGITKDNVTVRVDGASTSGWRIPSRPR